MRIGMIPVLAASCFAILGAAGSVYGCGTERWPVKVGDDPDALKVDLTTAVPTTIGALDALAAPQERPDAARASSAERTLYVLEATLYAYKLESDGDYHLALRAPGGQTLIAEIPDPACVDTASPFLEGIKRARAAFDQRLKAYRRFRRVELKVKVTGIGFFDFDHHQRGVAPNAIELHPLLDISFL